MPPQIGLTGGPGCGKSAASEFFGSHGFAIIDTDQLSREVVEPGQPAHARLRQDFGPECFDPDGRLLRDKLAAVAFADPAALRRLNAIVHPEVRALWQSRAARLLAMGRPVLVVIPLLFESGLESAFERVVCVGCSRSVQHERLRARGWNDTMIRDRLAAQWPLEKKCRLAHYVIWNDGPFPLLQRQVAALAAVLHPPASRSRK